MGLTTFYCFLQLEPSRSPDLTLVNYDCRSCEKKPCLYQGFFYKVWKYLACVGPLLCDRHIQDFSPLKCDSNLSLKSVKTLATDTFIASIILDKWIIEGGKSNFRYHILHLKPYVYKSRIETETLRWVRQLIA